MNGWPAIFPVRRCLAPWGKVRAKDRCWRCDTCAPLDKMAFESYLNQGLCEQLERDRHLGTARQTNRRLRLVTIRALRGVSFEELRNGVEHSLLPWLDSRMNIVRYVGCLIPETEDDWAHAHLVVDSEHFPNARMVWEAEHPESATTWADTGRNGLTVLLLRAPTEVRLREKGPVQDLLRDVRRSPQRQEMLERNVGDVRYLAQQVPPAGIPPLRRFWIESDNFGVGFARYRDDFIEDQRRRVFVSELLDREASRALARKTTPVHERVVPAYGPKDRVRTGVALGQLRQELGIQPHRSAPTRRTAPKTR
jgi:hypothetical protein